MGVFRRTGPLTRWGSNVLPNIWLTALGMVLSGSLFGACTKHSPPPTCASCRCAEQSCSGRQGSVDGQGSVDAQGWAHAQSSADSPDAERPQEQDLSEPISDVTDSASPASEGSADQEPSDTATTDAPATSSTATSAFATSDRESEPPPEGDARWVRLPFRMTFPSSGNELNEQQRMLLREVTHTLSARRDVQKLRVEGHTDGRGADAVNDNLSLERARAVLEYLVQLGVPRDMLEAVGYGATSPITSDTSDLDRAQNRRVEFSILVVIPKAS